MDFPISGRVLPGKKSGPQPYLSAEEEDELAMFVTRCASIEYGMTRKDVLALVQHIYSSRGLNITISSGWWDSFVQRHAVKIPGSVDQREALAKKHDLAFIPLYTPSKRSCSSVSKILK